MPLLGPDSRAASKALAYLNNTLGTRSDVTLPALTDITVTGATVGAPVTVNVPVTVSIVLPVMSNVLGSSVTLNGVAIMQVSQ